MFTGRPVLPGASFLSPRGPWTPQNACTVSIRRYSNHAVLEHRLSIFVYRRIRGVPEYLFVRPHPVAEFDWQPINAALPPAETLRSASIASMQERYLAPPPDRWVDLNLFEHLAVGDLDLVDWCVGYGIQGGWEPADERGDREGICWRPLMSAFQLLENEVARRALIRLHLAAS